MKLIVLVLIIVLLLGLIAGWRARRRRRAEFIAAYPYRQFLDRRLASRRPELTPSQRELVLDGLRQYFQICRDAGNRLVAMPSQVVDDAWHEFILFTRQYQEFCWRGFGRFLHHTPAEAMRTPTAAQDGIKRAWRLACRNEAIDPKAPSQLPLLFALDATLAISGGFVYRLDCLAATARGSGAYCAGHIGCGGGCSGGDSSAGSGDGGSDGGGGCGGGCGGGGGD